MASYRMARWTAGCVVLLAMAASASVVRGDPRDDSNRNNAHRLAQQWVEAWNSHDPDRVAALFTNDALYEDVTFGIVNRGPDQIKAFAQFFFAAVPDLHITFVDGSVKGGRGTIEWVFSGTDHGVYGTGKTFAVRGVTVLEVRGSRISRNSDYFDLATVLRQLGLLPSGS